MYVAFSLVVAAFFAVPAVLAAPHIQGYRQDPYVPETETPCKNGTAGENDVYDQRQNGTENYRINVNGVVVLLAPAETLLAAASLPGMDGELGTAKPPKVTTPRPLPLEGSTSETASSTVDPCEGGKCILNATNSTNVRQRGKLKMMNNLLQLFRSLKDESQPAIN